MLKFNISNKILTKIVLDTSTKCFLLWTLKLIARMSKFFAALLIMLERLT